MTSYLLQNSQLLRGYKDKIELEVNKKKIICNEDKFKIQIKLKIRIGVSPVDKGMYSAPYVLRLSQPLDKHESTCLMLSQLLVMPHQQWRLDRRVKIIQRKRTGVSFRCDSYRTQLAGWV